MSGMTHTHTHTGSYKWVSEWTGGRQWWGKWVSYGGKGEQKQKDTEIMHSLLLSLSLSILSPSFLSFNHTTSVDTQLKYRTLRCCQVDKREREREAVGIVGTNCYHYNTHKITHTHTNTNTHRHTQIRSRDTMPMYTLTIWSTHTHTCNRRPPSN